MHAIYKLTTLCSFVAVFAAPCLPRSEAADSKTTVTHKLELTDPVTPGEPAQTYSVRQLRDENGFPVAYCMSFETPVCIDEQCRIVSCTMYWNGLGYYERLEYPADTPLTKRKHVPFEPSDYARLDEILKDRGSVLGTISLEALVPQAAKDASPERPLPEDMEVDGWSGATPSTIKLSVVEDAAYTSWAMWRWANGQIVPKLQRLTRQSCTPRYLRHLLRSEDRRDVDFALKHLLEFDDGFGRFTEDLLHVLETGDREHVALALKYLDRAPPDQRSQLYERLIDACRRMKDNLSPVVLDYFAAKPELPPETLEALTRILDRSPYFQIHLVLRMLDRRGYFSEEVESNIVELLDNDNFFIARRAYEHLSKCDVSAETTAMLQAFREKHGDRL
jgi:hypothetical protein